VFFELFVVIKIREIRGLILIWVKSPGNNIAKISFFPRIKGVTIELCPKKCPIILWLVMDFDIESRWYG
jgi:hypothetical protein